EALASGEAILVTRRLGGAGTDPNTFGFRWFWPSILRYRRPLTHVLVASLFVQLFALATPIFFQLVVDKVLVHKGMSTLVVLVVGMVTLGLFESVLQFLRSYTLSHTTNRIDVELGRRLFHHLFRLPLAYFETRAAGQTVARMRELETIRSFLTGQGLTALIDLVFTLVFIGVMFVYSVKLTLVVLVSIPVYVLIAAVLRPILREQINERFNRGARSQQFLVESIVGAHAEGGERRADDAGAMGGAARLLREQVLRRRRHRRARPEHDPVREQGHDGADRVRRRRGGDRGLDVGRRAHRLQHDREPGRAADPAPVAALAGFPAGAGVGGAARRHPQFAARARAAKPFDPAAAERGDRVPQRKHALPARRARRPAQRDAVDRAWGSGRDRRAVGLGQVDADKIDPAPLWAPDRTGDDRWRRRRPARSG